ncbi:site-specific integrase [Rhodococcus koreensis]|uniref:site-specific integrase n=1 Tax=Rhodococcus koreensis TaxID=99653 RepID=UPI00198250F5|nr:site-specific integrase [Rhodococcus koreensis]QSE86136.1 site-specific integrase [Rhodococcus koreensis]
MSSDREYVVSPLVRKVKRGRVRNLEMIPEPLRDRVEAALASTPVDEFTGRAVATKLDRVLLGARGMPFHPGNVWLRRLMDKADSTRDQYPGILRMWLDSCASQGADPLAMSYDTLLEYRDDVRFDIDGVSHRTWNRDLSALKWFAETAESIGAMHSVPERDWRSLRLRDTSVRWPSVVESDDYRRFRSVGLQAMTLQGRPGSATGSVRTPLRDALFADFLLLHGARRAEACHLTLLDLPERRAGKPVNIGYLPPNICKWGSGRELEERAVWTQRLTMYHDTEWFALVEQAQPNLHRLRHRGQLLVVTKLSNRFGLNTMLTIDGRNGARNLLNLSKSQRRRLVCTPEVARTIGSERGMGASLESTPDDWLVPLAVFPGVRSPMLAPEAWSMTFREANERVAIASSVAGRPEPRRITPHMLRHSFATEWLSTELKRIACDDADFARAMQNSDTMRLRRRHINPLLRIKEILGHRSLDTTLLYINYISRDEEVQYMAGDSWIESFIADAS